MFINLQYLIHFPKIIAVVILSYTIQANISLFFFIKWENHKNIFEDIE